MSVELVSCSTFYESLKWVIKSEIKGLPSHNHYAHSLDPFLSHSSSILGFAPLQAIVAVIFIQVSHNLPKLIFHLDNFPSSSSVFYDDFEKHSKKKAARVMIIIFSLSNFSLFFESTLASTAERAGKWKRSEMLFPNTHSTVRFGGWWQ